MISPPSLCFVFYKQYVLASHFNVGMVASKDSYRAGKNEPVNILTIFPSTWEHGMDAISGLFLILAFHSC